MPFSFQCPHCSATYTLDDTMAGKQAKCRCGNAIILPAAQAPANPPSAPMQSDPAVQSGVADPGLQPPSPQPAYDPNAVQHFQQPQQPAAYQDPAMAMQQAVQPGTPMQQPMQPGMPMQPAPVQPAPMPMSPSMGMGAGYGSTPRPSNAAGMMVLMAGIMGIALALNELYRKGDTVYDHLKVMGEVTFTMRYGMNVLGQLGLFFAILGIAVAGVGLLISSFGELAGKSYGYPWARMTGMISGFTYIGIRTLFLLYGMYELISHDARISILLFSVTSYVYHMMIPLFLVVLYFVRRRG